MTVKQLKQNIKNLPDDAEVLFALWGLKQDKHTFFTMKSGNEMIHETNSGRKAVIVGSADNCRAHQMVRKGKILHY